MTACYITLSARTSNVMMASVTSMHTYVEINFEGDKITFKRSFLGNIEDLTRVIISYEIY